jgi:hypothetical protein
LKFVSDGLAVVLLVGSLAAVASSAHATADGPDYFAVIDVASDAALSLRAEPSVTAEEVGRIAHDARGLRNLGCRGLPSLAEWERMSGAERAQSRDAHWCRVRYRGLEGWLPGRFLVEDAPLLEPSE